MKKFGLKLKNLTNKIREKYTQHCYSLTAKDFLRWSICAFFTGVVFLVIYIYFYVTTNVKLLALEVIASSSMIFAIFSSPFINKSSLGKGLLKTILIILYIIVVSITVYSVCQLISTAEMIANFNENNIQFIFTIQCLVSALLVFVTLNFTSKIFLSISSYISSLIKHSPDNSNTLQLRFKKVFGCIGATAAFIATISAPVLTILKIISICFEIWKK